MGPYREIRHAFWWSLLLLLAVAALIHLPWVFSGRELFRQEGLYAVEATEYNIADGVVTAHGVALKNGFPLYPAVCHYAEKWIPLPLETTMRLISIAMFLLTATGVFFGAKSGRNAHAGIVAAAIYLTSFVTMEKAWEGNPVTISAFFLLLAQLFFFYYGIRRSDWNKAWISAGILMGLGFLSGGFRLLLFFVLPMFFFRRPLSMKSKFHHPGFVFGIILFGIAFAAWAVPLAVAYHQIPLDYQFWSRSSAEFWYNIVSFPFKFLIQLLPWTLIIWLPFCPALRDTDATPIYDRYLRTLVLPAFAIIWLAPEFDAREVLYLLGPLAILCGNAYELGMRRYGLKIKKLLLVCEYAAGTTIILMTLMLFAPEWLLGYFGEIGRSLKFRDAPEFQHIQIICYALAFLLLLAIRIERCRDSVARTLLLTSAVIGVYYSGIYLRYHEQGGEKRIFGDIIASALENQPRGTLYKANIADLYGPLYYAHVPVVKLPAPENLPNDEEVVYLLGESFPLHSDRSWRNLLPPGYTYQGHALGLWMGTRNEKDE